MVHTCSGSVFECICICAFGMYLSVFECMWCCVCMYCRYTTSVTTPFTKHNRWWMNTTPLPPLFPAYGTTAAGGCGGSGTVCTPANNAGVGVLMMLWCVDDVVVC